jgi:hypothetical protein
MTIQTNSNTRRYEEDALDGVDISSFSWWDVATIIFQLYFIPLVVNLIQQSLPYIYDPEEDFRTSCLILFRITVFGYIGLAMNFTFIPHMFGVKVYWWYTLIAVAGLTIFVVPLQLYAVYRLGYTTVIVVVIVLLFDRLRCILFLGEYWDVERLF